MAGLLLYAYSLGAGTYTGIEAVSNSVPLMREPRVATAKRTMLCMAASLALTAGGLILAYLLLDVKPAAGKTMNQVVTELFVGELGGAGSWLGVGFVVLTLASEAALLIVAAQAGFIDGPRVLANMARDAWAPHWLANLSFPTG
jgi:amino acid transporter